MATSSSRQFRLADEELSTLADNIALSDTRPLAKALGMSDVELDRIRREYPRPAYTILKQWTREQFHGGSELRTLLGERLAGAGLQQLSIQLLNGDFSTSFAANNYHRSPHPTLSGPSTSKGLSEDFLISLAEGIEQEEHEESLGRALGFTLRQVRDFQETNYLTRRKTRKGTKEMLLEWRQRVSPDRQHEEMRKALLKAGLRFLADLHFGTKPNILCVQITPTMNFQYCIDIMRNHYKTVFCKVQRRPWDPHDYVSFDRLYTEMHLLRCDKSTGEMRKVPFHGTVSEVMSMKVAESSKRILLLAPGGYGKTCAIAKLAYDWAYEVEGSPMKDIPALFALLLRKVDEDMGLGEAIISQLLGIIPGVNPKILEEIITLHEKECALLCDGYDEFAKSIRDTKSRNSLVQVLQNKRLKNCPVLVTSRPFPEDDFQQGDLSRVYIRIEGKGYTPQLAHQFIEKYFELRSNPQDGRNLIRFLQSNSFLGDMIHIPFFCTMLCHLHEVQTLSETHTRNSLFRVFNIFLFHHARAKNMEIPDQVQILDRVLHALGEVALRGLLQESRKLVFEEQDFKDCYDAYEKGLTLGILSKTPSPVNHVDHEAVSKTYVEFSHVWQQEYCASLFLQKPNLPAHRFSTVKMNKRSAVSPFRSLRRNTGSPIQEQEKLQTLLDMANTPKKIIEFENMFRLLAASENIQVCQTVFGHISHVNWRDAAEGRGCTHAERCRFILHCVSEADARYLTQSVTEAIRKYFIEGRLSLENTTACMIRGMKSLHSDTKALITTAEITHSCLTSGLLRSLSFFEALSVLHVSDISSVEGSPQEHEECIPQLPSVKEFKASWVEPTVLRTLSRCIPSVEAAVMHMRLDTDTGTEDMSAITAAVEGMGRTLKTLVIFAPSREVGRVPTEACQEFGRVLVHAASHLETLTLWFLQTSETGMIDIVKFCQQAARIKNVRFLGCGFVQRNGDLCTFLDGVARNGAVTKRGREIVVRVNDHSWTIPRVPKASSI